MEGIMSRLPTVALLALLSSVSPAAALNVTDCGQVVSDGDVGVLQNDIVCSGAEGIGVGRRATLQLNGFSISGGTVGVRCLINRCTVEGPGEIHDIGACAVSSPQNIGPIRFYLRDLDLHDSQCGVGPGSGSQAKVFLENVVVRDNVADGIGGISAHGAGHVRGTNVDVSNNGGRGLFGKQISLEIATIEDNGAAGLFNWFGVTSLRNVSVTGNDAAGNGFDVATHKRPKARDLSCGRSVVVPKVPAQPTACSPSWGVCSND
jgi:hypothetical protein